MISPNKFNLEATIDHHRLSVYCDHYTTFVNCSEKAFYYNGDRITEGDIGDILYSSTAYILMYKLIIGKMFDQTVEDGG